MKIIEKIHLNSKLINEIQNKNFKILSDKAILLSDKKVNNLKICNLDNYNQSYFKGVWVEYNLLKNNQEIQNAKSEFCFDYLLFYK